ncbi:MAG: hypothetical protein ACI8XO_003684, partial [Verrucomicrobiales bacterium]
NSILASPGSSGAKSPFPAKIWMLSAWEMGAKNKSRAITIGESWKHFFMASRYHTTPELFVTLLGDF